MRHDCVGLIILSLCAACDDKGSASAPDAGAQAAAASASAGEKLTERRDALLEQGKQSSEAKNQLGAITRGVIAAAAKEPEAVDTLAIDDEPQPKLPPSTTPVPADASKVAGKAYESTDADWESWKPLGYRADAPLPCQLSWTLEGDAGLAAAKCDFDGDGKLDYHLVQSVTIVNGVAKAGAVEERIALPKQ